MLLEIAVPNARSPKQDSNASVLAGKRSPTQQIFDPGFFQIAGSAHRFRDDKKEGHGYVDMMKSIIVSCDTYYYMLAADTDIDVTHDFLAQFQAGDRHDPFQNTAKQKTLFDPSGVSAYSPGCSVCSTSIR